ncbi:MAG: hypothetical protein IJZ72_06360 [Oscillospiraceae bacterium]|nr:hypothetical protein [Oscillospiraceae bacterium]
MAEYSNIALQTVDVNDNILFANGNRTCRKGYIIHRDGSGVFTLKGAGCKALYRVQFNANIAVSAAVDGGVLEPISVSLAVDGEVIGNAVAIVTPAAIGDFFNVSLATYVDVPCGCCVTIAVENTSDTTAIDVVNANLIVDRVA